MCILRSERERGDGPLYIKKQLYKVNKIDSCLVGKAVGTYQCLTRMPLISIQVIRWISSSLRQDGIQKRSFGQSLWIMKRRLTESVYCQCAYF